MKNVVGRGADCRRFVLGIRIIFLLHSIAALGVGVRGRWGPLPCFAAARWSAPGVAGWLGLMGWGSGMAAGV